MIFDQLERFIRKSLSSIKSTLRGALNLIKKCPECEADLEIPDDVIPGEVISCPDCGMDYEVHLKEDEEVIIKPAEIEGEDWGE